MKVRDSIPGPTKSDKDSSGLDGSGATGEPTLVSKVERVDHDSVLISIPAKHIKLGFFFGFHHVDALDNFLQNLGSATTFNEAYGEFALRSRITECWLDDRKLDAPPPEASEFALERFYKEIPLSMDEHYIVRETAFQAFLAEARKRMAPSKPDTIAE